MRVKVPLPFTDQLNAWGDFTRRQMHEALVSAKEKIVPVAALVSTQETVGSEMLARYEQGKGKSRKAPIVVPSAEGLAIYDGHHRATAAVKRGERTIRARVASPGPRPPIRFRTSELVMMRPGAMAVEYKEHDVEDVADLVGDVAVICIDTPLEAKPGASWWGYFDDYESILCRFENAIRSDEVRSVLLKIDSPGGAASGLNECCDAMIRLKKKTGKRVVAYADEGAYSAAYALACTADEIYLPKAGGLGSIGVRSQLVDFTEANAKEGIRVEVVTSGKRKADGDPNVPMTDAAIRHVQRRVDGLAKLYWRLVAKSRGLSRSYVAGLEADTFYGRNAVRRGLADDVKTLDEVLSMMALDKMGSSESGSKSKRNSGQSDGETMTKKQAREALDAAIATGDAQKIAAASTALAQVQASKKIVTTETKSTESSSESSESSESSKSSEEEEEEEESEKMPSSKAGSSESSESSKSSESSESSKSSTEDEEEEEEEEEEKKDAEEDEKAAKARARVAAAAIAAGSDPRKAIQAAIAGALAERSKPLRKLARAARKITGRKSLSSVAGALDAMPPVKQLAKEVASLKADKVRAKVDGYLSKAKHAGKITAAQVDSLRSQGLKDPKWLKGHLATLPKLVKMAGGAFVPRAGTDGQGAPSNADQEKIRAAALTGMSPEERKKFEADASAAYARLNGGMPRI